MEQLNTNVTTEQVEEWVNEHTAFLMNKAYFWLSNKEDAEDIVQEVFLSLCQKPINFSGKSSARTWLTAILHNKVMDLYKRRYKTTNVDFQTIFDKSGEWNHEGEVNQWGEEDKLFDNKEFIDTFNKCIYKLPIQWKMVISEFYFEENKAADICTALNLTQTNYWKILQRSRLQLKDCLQINWFNK